MPGRRPCRQNFVSVPATGPVAIPGHTSVSVPLRVAMPAGWSSLSATFRTADTSPDNKYTFYLVDPSGTVVATAGTPSTTGTPGTAEVSTASPAAGTWTIDVELNLTVSGKEFTQTVDAAVQDP